MSSASENGSIPLLPPDSPGSSVSSKFQEEYDELLKYAVVVPNLEQGMDSAMLINVPSFSQQPVGFRDISHKVVSDSDHTVEEEEERDREDYDTDSHISIEQLPQPGQQAESTPIMPVRSKPVSRPEKQIDLLQARISFSEDVESLDKEEISTQSSAAFSSNVDPDVARMEQTLDQWSYELKRNILAEFSQSKIKVIQEHRQQMLREKERHAHQVDQLHNEIENLKELLHNYEQSIERKDQVISNLTRGLQKQKEKLDMAKSFSEWKINHIEQKREDFASRLALKHYSHNISQRVWNAWHSMVESKWKQRVEKACQAKAQEVCMTLTNDYETKIASLNEALESACAEVTKLHAERERYEEMMKKAFMRGVCALNLEAMTMFSDPQESEGQKPSGDLPGRDMPSAVSGLVNILQESPQTSAPSTGRVVYSQSVMQSSATLPPHSKTTTTKEIPSARSSRQGKTLSAKISTSAKSSKTCQSTRGLPEAVGLAPPMSSVIVERHQPVVKETIGHATASKYPASKYAVPVNGSTRLQQQQVIPSHKIAGQTGSLQLNPNVQTIKVVD